jgi:hypothetical protein
MSCCNRAINDKLLAKKGKKYSSTSAKSFESGHGMLKEINTECGQDNNLII